MNTCKQCGGETLYLCRNKKCAGYKRPVRTEEEILTSIDALIANLAA